MKKIDASGVGVSHVARRSTSTQAPNRVALLGETLDLQPVEAVCGPGMMRAAGVAAAESHAVAAFLVDVEVEGDAGVAEGFGEHEGVFHFDGVVFVGVEEERRRGVFGDL